MDLTNVTASVVGLQQYSRPGHSDIYMYHGRREGVAQTVRYNRSIYSNGGTAGHSAPAKRLTNLKKNIIPERCTLGKFG